MTIKKIAEKDQRYKKFMNEFLEPLKKVRGDIIWQNRKKI